MNSIILDIKTLIASPLDQFCDEETELQEFCRKHIVDIDYLDIIEEVELLLTISVGILAGSIASLELDSNDEEMEWDEADSALTMNQSAVLVSNLSGVVPGSETITAELSLVFMLSFSTVIAYIYFGFVLHEHRYASIIFPAGTYIVMAPFILMIELISFLARAISLGMRLFANMFAGHSLFKIIYTFSWITLMSPYFVFSFLMLGLAILLSFLEAGIAYLQAYVYGSLTNMYHSESISLSH